MVTVWEVVGWLALALRDGRCLTPRSSPEARDGGVGLQTVHMPGAFKKQSKGMYAHVCVYGCLYVRMKCLSVRPSVFQSVCLSVCTPPPPSSHLCPSYALVQATVGVGTVLIWDLI